MTEEGKDAARLMIFCYF